MLAQEAQQKTQPVFQRFNVGVVLHAVAPRSMHKMQTCLA